MKDDVKVTVGLYRHFKGEYYYVTGLSKNITDVDTIMVNYFNVCHPEYGSFVRTMNDFISDLDDNATAIVLRKDNKTGQFKRFERVKDLNFQLESISTEQLIKELGKRVDSPIHELDIGGLRSPIFCSDFVVGIPYTNPEYSKGVDTLVSCDTEEQAKKYLSTHKVRRDTGIYKRTFIKLH